MKKSTLFHSIGVGHSNTVVAWEKTEGGESGEEWELYFEGVHKDR